LKNQFQIEIHLNIPTVYPYAKFSDIGQTIVNQSDVTKPTTLKISMTLAVICFL